MTKISKLRTVLGLTSVLALSACGGDDDDKPPAAASTAATQRDAVRSLLKAIETGDQAAIAVINPDKYTQHNLGVADGLAGFAAVLQELPGGSAKVDTARLIVDGDLVAAHTAYNFFGPKIGFDVFRFEEGKIVEHWDNLQVATATAVNPSGRTMIDGTTEVTDLDKTEVNRALVKDFYEKVLVGGDMGSVADYFDGDAYLQHNPNIGDGLATLGKAMTAMADAGQTMVFSKIHHVIAEGNFVLVMAEGRLAGASTAYYDLFRVDGGKIAEHWDVIQAIPAASEWKNDNGKF